MEDLFFWKTWERNRVSTPTTRIYLFTLLTLAGSLLAYLAYQWMGENALIHWEVQSQLEDVPVVLDRFVEGLFNVKVTGINYVITEKFIASDPVISPWAVYLLLGGVALGSVIGLSVITYLSRFWYVMGMAGFLLLLVALRLELLTLAGFQNNLPLGVVMALFGGVSYYFHAFRPDVGFGWRTLTFALLTAALALAIGLLARAPQPALHLASYGIIAPLLIGLVFTFVVSTEIPYTLLYLVTRSNNENSRNSILHFSVATLIYLGNLLLIYLKNAGILELDMLYLGPFLIYIVSVVLGVWGYGSRSAQFEEILPYAPYGALWYNALAIISTVTFGYLFATANDPLIETFEDTLVFSHLSMGVLFFFYVLVNFGSLLQQNLKVYKVVYKPTRMPFFIARGAALVMMLALFFRASMVPYYQAIGGYYNGLGDLSTATKEYFLAEQYYKLGAEYGYNNHKSYYSLAALAHVQNDPVATEYYLGKATQKHPSPYDYANLSHVQQQNDEFFEALFTLKEGVRRFPESGELYNNLALLYNRTSLADSAYLFFDLSRGLVPDSRLVESNLLALWAKTPGIGKLDSLIRQAPAADYLPLQNNRTVLQNQLGAAATKEFSPAFVTDSTLNRNTFAYLYNQSVGQAMQPDTNLAARLSLLERNDQNALYAEDLAFARADYEYHYGNRATAIQILKQLSTQATGQAGFYQQTLGAWLLQQQAYRLSAEYSAQAKTPQARFNRAVALTSGKMKAEARTAWEQIVHLADSMRSDGKPLAPEYPQMKPLAQQMLKVYGSSDPAGLTEDEQALFARYQRDDTMLTADPALQGLYAIADRKDYPALLAAIDKLPGQTGELGQVWYLKAFAYEQTGDLKRAEAAYQRALQRLPLDETTVTQASAFFRDRKKNDEAAYNVLLNTIQLNPYAVKVYQAYVRQCLKMGLLSYAEQGMEQLQEIASPADYQAFLPEYQQNKALIEKQAAGFH